MMDICKENGAYDAKHFLCYYYYGGMIYTGLKNFERALYFYEQVIISLNPPEVVLNLCDQRSAQLEWIDLRPLSFEWRSFQRLFLCDHVNSGKLLLKLKGSGTGGKNSTEWGLI